MQTSVRGAIQRQRRPAVAAVELAVCLPAIVLIVFAAIEGCSMIFITQALHAANQSVGRSMTLSTLALVAGFTALAASDFVPTIYFGALTALTMIGGLLGNLVVLPVLLMAVSRDQIGDSR